MLLPFLSSHAVDVFKKPTPPTRTVSEFDFWDAKRRFHQHLFIQSQTFNKAFYDKACSGSSGFLWKREILCVENRMETQSKQETAVLHETYFKCFQQANKDAWLGQKNFTYCTSLFPVDVFPLMTINSCHDNTLCFVFFTDEVPAGYPDKKEVTTTEVIMYIPGIPNMRSCL